MAKVTVKVEGRTHAFRVEEPQPPPGLFADGEPFVPPLPVLVAMLDRYASEMVWLAQQVEAQQCQAAPPPAVEPAAGN